MNTISSEKKSYNKEDDQYIVDKTAMSNIELHDNGIGEDDPNYSRSSTFSADASADMRGTTTDAKNLYSAEEENESTSLYFPQAASLYDTAHEMDPPMWGDNLDDLTTGMLSDNEEFLNLMSLQNDDDIIIGGKSSSDLNTTPIADFKEDARERGDQSVAGGDSFIDFYKDTDLPIHMDTLEDNMYTIGVLPPQVSEKSMNIYTDGELLNNSYTMSNSSKGSVTESLLSTEEEDDDDEEKTSLQELPTTPARCLLPLEKKHKKQILDTPPSEPESLPVVTPQALKTSSSMLVPGHSLHGVSSMQPLSSHTPPGSPTIGHLLNNAPKIRRPHTPPGSPPPPELSTFNPFIMRRRVSQTSTSSCGSINNHNDIAKAKNHDEIWQQRFAELEEFTRLNGHCNVPQKYDKNPCFGSWVSRQRTLMREFEEEDKHRDHAVSYYDRIICLKSLGLTPSVGRGKGKRMSYSNWDKNFADLIKYRDTNGHCDVNTKTSSLGRWVGGQRNLYKKHNEETGNKGKDLPHDKELEKRFQKLKDAGFKFSIGKGSGRRC